MVSNIIKHIKREGRKKIGRMKKTTKYLLFIPHSYINQFLFCTSLEKKNKQTNKQKK